MTAAPQVRACGVFMAEKAPLLPRSLIYRKFSYSRPFLFAFLRKILYTISVNRLRESLNGTSSAIEGRPRFARELINMRESPNGMASAFEGRSRFARERASVRRPAEGTPLGVSADTRLSRARIRAHLAPFLNLTKPKQRGLDRKRVSRHICIVKALGNMSLYYLRALPRICSDLPACDCFAP